MTGIRGHSIQKFSDPKPDNRQSGFAAFCVGENAADGIARGARRDREPFPQTLHGFRAWFQARICGLPHRRLP
jgi:hypothetical protein